VPVVDKLKSAKLIVINDEEGGWMPAQDFHSLTVDHILKKLDSVGENDILTIEKWQLPEQIIQWESDYQQTLESTFSQSNIASIKMTKDN
jgi:hypothetical protein